MMSVKLGARELKYFAVLLSMAGHVTTDALVAVVRFLVLQGVPGDAVM